MRYVYPAIFTPDEEAVRVRVPDLPSIFTFGNDLADAIFMAEDAIGMWLWDAENKQEDIPPASGKTEMELQCEKHEFVSLILVDTDEFRRNHDTRAVKKTLSIPSWLNRQAERANAPFSQILQQGLKDYLNIRE